MAIHPGQYGSYIYYVYEAWLRTPASYDKCGCASQPLVNKTVAAGIQERVYMNDIWLCIPASYILKWQLQVLCMKYGCAPQPVAPNVAVHPSHL